MHQNAQFRAKNAKLLGRGGTRFPIDSIPSLARQSTDRFPLEKPWIRRWTKTSWPLAATLPTYRGVRPITNCTPYIRISLLSEPVTRNEMSMRNLIQVFRGGSVGASGHSSRWISLTVFRDGRKCRPRWTCNQRSTPTHRISVNALET